MDEKIVKDSQGLAKELVNDTISRQAAIHAICRDGVRLERGGALMITISTAKQWAVNLLSDLPSVQPSSSCSHDAEQLEPDEPFESCSNCIHDHDSEDICILRLCKHAIAETVECFEPKQPKRKRGKWKGYNTDKGGWKRTDGSPVFLICSECGGTVLNNGSARWNFCPNCGSEMQEWDDERSD